MMRPLSLWFLSFSVFQPRCKGTPASCGTTGTCGPCFAVCFALVMCKDKACSATHLKTAKSNAKSWIIGHRSLMAMMYWCMYVCVCLSIYLCTYVRRHAWMYVNIYMWYPLISVVTHDALVKFKEAAFLTPTGAAAASPSSWRLIPSPDEVMWIRTDRTPSCCNFNWGNMGKRGKVINVLKQWSNVINTIHICNMYIYIIQIQCECNMNKI